MISLIQLEYIVAVDTHRHFATAAEKCFVTQPTLSMQIKKLEEELEVLIFDRSKQPVVPTSTGTRIIEQARLVLLETNRIQQIVEEEKESISGELRIGIIPTISPYLLPLFSGAFKTQYPDIRLVISEMITEDIVTALHKDQLDTGILVTPVLENGIFEKPLYYEEIQIYTHPEHELMNYDKIHIKDMEMKDMWLLNDGHCFKHQVVNLCKLNERNTSDLPFEFSGGNIDTLMKIIDKDGGYTLIPELAARELKQERLKQLRSFALVKPLREVSLVYTRKYVKARLISELAKSIVAAVPPDLHKKERGTIVEWK